MLYVYLCVMYVYVWYLLFLVVFSEYLVLYDNIYSMVDMYDLVGVGFGVFVGVMMYEYWNV